MESEEKNMLSVPLKKYLSKSRKIQDLASNILSVSVNRPYKNKQLGGQKK